MKHSQKKIHTFYLADAPVRKYQIDSQSILHEKIHKLLIFLQLRHDVVSPPIENGDSKHCEEHESDQGFADYYSSNCVTRNSLKSNGKCSDYNRKAKISDHPQKQSDNKSDTESDSSDSDSSDSSDSSDDDDRVTPSGIFSSKKFFKNPEMSKTCSVPEPGFESRQREHLASSSSRVCQVWSLLHIFCG